MLSLEVSLLLSETDYLSIALIKTPNPDTVSPQHTESSRLELQDEQEPMQVFDIILDHVQQLNIYYSIEMPCPDID